MIRHSSELWQLFVRSRCNLLWLVELDPLLRTVTLLWPTEVLLKGLLLRSAPRSCSDVFRLCGEEGRAWRDVRLFFQLLILELLLIS